LRVVLGFGVESGMILLGFGIRSFRLRLLLSICIRIRCVLMGCLRLRRSLRLLLQLGFGRSR